jgi:vitamin B12 transporter
MLFNRKILLLFVFVLINAMAIGQSKQPDDSTAIYPLPVVTVTANPVGPAMFRTPFSVSNISLSDSVAIKNTSLEDVISSAGGIFIKDYGAMSGIKTISQRGLGSEHTLFLLNGMRISSFQNGLVDLGVLPLDGAGRVIVTRGGQSAEYGSDAVGGSVNIIPGFNLDEIHGTRLTYSSGSFGRMKFHINEGVSFNQTAILDAGLGIENSNEDFPFLFHNGSVTTTVIRQNADLKSQFGHLRSAWLINSFSTLSLYSTYYNSDRGSPGPVSSPTTVSHARQSDRDALVQAGYTISFPEGRAFSIYAQGHYAYERYNDPDLIIAAIPLDDYFRNIDLRVTAKFTDSFEEGRFQFTAGAEAARTSAEGNSIAGDVSRNEGGLFVIGVSNFTLNNPVFSNLSFFPAMRIDIIEPSMTVFSPQAGAVLKFNTTDIGFLENFQSAIRTNVSRNFRMPTFNELYYAMGGGIGNPNLEPEHSTSFDIGGDQTFSFAGDHLLKETFFLVDMENRITWVAAGGLNVTPKNLRHVRSNGWEVGYQWHSERDIVTVDMNYTRNTARKISEDYANDPTVEKQLIYIPEEMANVSFGILQHFNGIALRSLGITFRTQYTGFRYTTEDNASFLPSHYVSSLECHSRFDLSNILMRLRFEVKNLFDEDYQAILSYPMPMRSYQVTAEIEY